MHSDARARIDMDSRQRSQAALERIAAKFGVPVPDMTIRRASDSATAATLERQKVADFLTALADHVDPQPKQEGTRDMSDQPQPTEPPVTLPANDPLPEGMPLPDSPDAPQPEKPAESPTVPAPGSTPAPGGTPAPRTAAKNEPEAQPASGRKVVDTGKPSPKGKS